MLCQGLQAVPHDAGIPSLQGNDRRGRGQEKRSTDAARILPGVSAVLCLQSSAEQCGAVMQASDSTITDGRRKA